MTGAAETAQATGRCALAVRVDPGEQRRELEGPCWNKLTPELQRGPKDAGDISSQPPTPTTFETFRNCVKPPERFARRAAHRVEVDIEIEVQAWTRTWTSWLEHPTLLRVRTQRI